MSLPGETFYSCVKQWERKPFTNVFSHVEPNENYFIFFRRKPFFFMYETKWKESLAGIKTFFVCLCNNHFDHTRLSCTTRTSLQPKLPLSFTQLLSEKKKKSGGKTRHDGKNMFPFSHMGGIWNVFWTHFYKWKVGGQKKELKRRSGHPHRGENNLDQITRKKKSSLPNPQGFRTQTFNWWAAFILKVKLHLIPIKW